MLIGISGLTRDESGAQGSAGAGKDTVADFMNPLGYVKVSCADPLKRICQEVFAFTDDQLWGPSASRNAPDKRYQRGSINAGHMLTAAALKEFPDGKMYLTPRYALQQLGTEWGRNCYEDVWIEYAIRVYECLQHGGFYYDTKTGLRTTSTVAGVLTPKTFVAIPDVRFHSEVNGIRRAGGKLVRVKRPRPALTVDPSHPSECGLIDLPDDAFDYVIENDGTLEELGRKVQLLFTGRVDGRPLCATHLDIATGKREPLVPGTGAQE